MRKWIASSLMLGLGGCSNFESHRFMLPPPGRTTTLNGLPFTLNRPVPTIVKTSAANGQPDSYAIVMAYAPDPAASYDVKMTPAWLAQTDFKLDYDANGSLTGVTAKVDNQTSAILTSAVKLALAVAPFLDQTKIDETQAVQQIDQAMATALARRPILIVDESGASRNATLAEARELTRAAPVLQSRLTAAAAAGAVATSFTVNNWAEEKLLRGALKELAAPPRAPQCAPPPPPGVQPPPPAPPPPGSTAVPPPPAAPLPPAVGLNGHPPAQRPVAVGDVVRSGTICDLAPADQTRFADMLARKDIAALQAAKDAAEKDIDRKYAEAAIMPPPSSGSLYESQGRRGAASQYIGLLKGDAPIGLLLTVLGRDSKAWQKLTLAQLDQQIATRRFEIRAAAAQGQLANENSDVRLVALVRQRAAVLGVAAIYDRRQRLERLLLSQSGKGDFKAMSDEITYLDKRLADAEPAKADATPAKADAAEPAAFFQSQGEIVDSDWIQTKLGKDWNRPKFVVVFDPSRLEAGSATQGFAPPAAAAAPPAGDAGKADDKAGAQK